MRITISLKIFQVAIIGLVTFACTPPLFAAQNDCAFTRTLSFGDTGEDVRCLQHYLNVNGHVLTTDGPGAPGEETTHFGLLTEAAVIKWQLANGVTPAIGLFGLISRATYDQLNDKLHSSPKSVRNESDLGLSETNRLSRAVAVNEEYKSAKLPQVAGISTATTKELERLLKEAMRILLEMQKQAKSRVSITDSPVEQVVTPLFDLEAANSEHLDVIYSSKAMQAVLDELRAIESRTPDKYFLQLEQGIVEQNERLLSSGARQIVPWFERSLEADIQTRFRSGVYAMRTLDLLRATSLPERDMARLQVLAESLIDDLFKTYSRDTDIVSDYANQQAWLAYIFLRQARITSDREMFEAGKNLIEQLLQAQDVTGFFPEKSGSDTQYNAETLLALTHIHVFADLSATESEKLRLALSRGFEWQQQQIDERGCITDQNNTRTAIDPRQSPEGKQLNPFTIRYNMIWVSPLAEPSADIWSTVNYLASCRQI